MIRAKWSKEKMGHISKKILPNYQSVEDALEEISNFMNASVTVQSLYNSFYRYGFEYPDRYIKYTYKSKYDKVVNKLNKWEELRTGLISSVTEAFEKVSPIHISRLNKKVTAIPIKKRRENCAMISDVHMGLRIDKEEVGVNEYNWEIAAYRLSKLAQQIAEYKIEHRDDCPTLRMLLGGDLGQGIIHFSTDSGTDLITYQVVGISYYLIQMIDYLRHYYKHIIIECTPDNHMRMTYRSPNRATAQKFDSFATIIHSMVQLAFRTVDDITINIPKAPISTFNVLGHKCALTHGDTHVRTGNISKHIPVEHIINQVLKLNASVTDFKPYKAILLGHIHTPMYLQLPESNISIITNGTASGTDGYGHSEGYFSSNPTQVLWEATEAYPVGDFRVVQLSDANKKNNIIKPYEYGLEVSRLLGVLRPK